jgi:4-amino-4-deoxy-L-arabinose transferase-like glycosyltransferase
MKTIDRKLVVAVLIGLLLRLAWVLWVNPQPKLEGGDGPFYLLLASEVRAGRGLNTASYGNQPTAVVGPVYPTFLAIASILSPNQPLQTARLMQVLLDIGALLILYAWARAWFGNRTAILLAFGYALDLRAVITAGEIYTESVFVFFLIASVAVYWLALKTDQFWHWIASGVLLSLAILTRPVLQPLIFLMALHLPIWFASPFLRDTTLSAYWQFTKSHLNPFRWQFVTPAMQRWVLLLLGCGFLLGTWVVRNGVTRERWEVAEGASFHFRIGATEEQWAGNKKTLEVVQDDKIADQAGGATYRYFENALKSILGKPLDYVRIRFSANASAWLQPFATVQVDDVTDSPPMKEMLMAIVRGEQSPLIFLTQISLIPKLWIYAWHFGSILLGMWGIFSLRKNLPALGLLLLPIISLAGVYAILTINPRYLYPTMPFLLFLAVIGWQTRKSLGDAK